MPANIFVNRFKEKNFAVEYRGVVQVQAEWNKDTGLSVSVLANDRGYAKNYLEPAEAKAFSEWLANCLKELYNASSR